MRDQAVGLLLGKADKLGIPIYWSHKLLDMDVAAQTCSFECIGGSGEKARSVSVRVTGCLVGADGTSYASV